MTRNNAQSELTDLFGTRTELQCIVDDLRSAGTVASGQRAEFEAELASLARQIMIKEGELKGLLPAWEARRMEENTEKKKLEGADTKLKAIFAKQGRVNRFRSKIDRDLYLRQEITSMDAYLAIQTTTMEAMLTELAELRRLQKEIKEKIVAVQGQIEDGRNRVKDLGDQALQLQDRQAGLVERRKELWREDTKFDTLVSQHMDLLKKAEGSLATLMDKVGFQCIKPASFIYSMMTLKDTGLGLRAVDKIAQRYGLEGVYGPLYRLFEVVDPTFNMPVELTAGNRYEPNKAISFPYLSS